MLSLIHICKRSGLYECLIEFTRRGDLIDPRHWQIPVRKAGKFYEKRAYIRRGVSLQIGGYPYDHRTCKQDPRSSRREDYL